MKSLAKKNISKNKKNWDSNMRGLFEEVSMYMRENFKNVFQSERVNTWQIDFESAFNNY